MIMYKMMKIPSKHHIYWLPLVAICVISSLVIQCTFYQICSRLSTMYNNNIINYSYYTVCTWNHKYDLCLYFSTHEGSLQVCRTSYGLLHCSRRAAAPILWCPFLRNFVKRFHGTTIHGRCQRLHVKLLKVRVCRYYSHCKTSMTCCLTERVVVYTWKIMKKLRNRWKHFQVHKSQNILSDYV